jgi:hypothetical protein
MSSNKNSLEVTKPLLLILLLITFSCTNQTKQNQPNSIQTQDTAQITNQKLAVDSIKTNQSKIENSDTPKIYGEWKGTDNTGTEVTMILDKTNHATFIGKNQVLGGDIEKDGIQFECVYDIDYTKNPIWLDIAARKKGEQEERVVMKGIVRFITDSKIEYRSSSYLRDRFKKFDFNDKENTIVFDKVVR